MIRLCKDCKNQWKKRRCSFFYGGSSYANICKFFEKKNQTNADRIRSMSDEELAELLSNDKFIERTSDVFCNHICQNMTEDGCSLDLESEPCPYTPKDDVLAWLRSENYDAD